MATHHHTLPMTTQPASEAKHTPDVLSEIAKAVASTSIHHIDEMYPAMWQGVAKAARTSVRNTIIASVKLEAKELVEQHDDLLAALRQLSDAVKMPWMQIRIEGASAENDIEVALRSSRAAIAKAEGSAR